MVIQNPDGTLTVQKQPPKDAAAKKALVIPPQVVTPFITAPQEQK
jgi:hypothetical protein